MAIPVSRKFLKKLEKLQAGKFMKQTLRDTRQLSFMDKHAELKQRYLSQLGHESYERSIEIIENFCNANKISGIDGLRGYLNFFKRLNLNIPEVRMEHSSLIRSFGEIAFMIWAYNILKRNDILLRIAKNFTYGGDFGDTSPYLGSSGNYFRNFELEAHIGLRFLERGCVVVPGQEGQPDYLINEAYYVEVKSPASRLALIQDILKAIVQITRTDKPGVIILCVDHMVAREMVSPSQQDGVLGNLRPLVESMLPDLQAIKLAAILVEYQDWDSGAGSAVEVFATEESSNQFNELIMASWQALSAETVNQIVPVYPKVRYVFPNRIDEIDPTNDGKSFFENNWPDL